jgi:hypothetical protein
MGETPERTIERLEEQLEGAEQTLSSLRPLDESQARRVAERMDRLHSQLLAVSEPPSLNSAHARLGTEPVAGEEFDALAGGMSPPDGEG